MAAHCTSIGLPDPAARYMTRCAIGPVISNGWSPGHGCRPGFGRRGDVLRVSVAPRARRRMSGSPAPAAGLSGTRNFGQNPLWEQRVMTDDLEPSPAPAVT